MVVPRGSIPIILLLGILITAAAPLTASPGPFLPASATSPRLSRLVLIHGHLFQPLIVRRTTHIRTCATHSRQSTEGKCRTALLCTICIQNKATRELAHNVCTNMNETYQLNPPPVPSQILRHEFCVVRSQGINV